MQDTTENLPAQNAETPHLRLKYALEISPNILMLIMTLGWMFFSGSAPDTVGKSFLWILPISVAVIYSIIYLLVHYGAVYCNSDSHFGTHDALGLFAKTTHQQVIVNTVRSFASGAVLASVTTFWSYNGTAGIISRLDPLSQPAAILDWLQGFLFFAILFVLWVASMFPIWAVFCNDSSWTETERV